MSLAAADIIAITSSGMLFVGFSTGKEKEYFVGQ
jgi:hypothetical protein